MAFFRSSVSAAIAPRAASGAAHAKPTLNAEILAIVIDALDRKGFHKGAVEQLDFRAGPASARIRELLGGRVPVCDKPSLEIVAVVESHIRVDRSRGEEDLYGVRECVVPGATEREIAVAVGFRIAVADIGCGEAIAAQFLDRKAGIAFGRAIGGSCQPATTWILIV